MGQTCKTCKIGLTAGGGFSRQQQVARRHNKKAKLKF